MTFRPSSPRARPRWLVLIGVVALLSGTFGSAALAFPPGPGNTPPNDSPFNALDAAPDCPPSAPDLNTAVNATTASTIRSVECTETDDTKSKDVTVNWIADTVSGSATDNAWGQGDKSDCYRAKTGGVHGACVTQVFGIGAGKTDLQYHGIALEKGFEGNDDFLYSGIKRLQAGGVTSSNANYNVEINQLLPAYQPADPICPLPDPLTGGCNMWRSPGDLTFMTDWGGNKSSCDTPTPAICAYVWIDTSTGPGFGGIEKEPNTGACFTKTNVPPCWGLLPGTNAALSANEDLAAGSINSGAATQPSTFSEIGINLTASGLIPEGECETFKNVWAHSRSSSSFTAELKDFIFGDVSISTCSSASTLLQQRSGADSDSNAANVGSAAKELTVAPGAWVRDTAAVTPSSATGNVKFKYYTSLALCNADTAGTSSGTGIVDVSTNALSSGTATSSTVQFNTVGDFYWRAFYLGNGLSPSASDCDEIVHVIQVDTAISSSPWYYPNDTATITAPNGGGDLAGNVVFKLYGATTEPAATALENCTANGAQGLLYTSASIDVTTGTGSGTSRTVSTNQSAVKVQQTATVYWRVTFTSTNPAQKGRNSVCVETINATLTGDAGPGTQGNTP